MVEQEEKILYKGLCALHQKPQYRGVGIGRRLTTDGGRRLESRSHPGRCRHGILNLEIKDC